MRGIRYRKRGIIYHGFSSFEHEKRLRSSAARSVDIVAMLVESAHAAAARRAGARLAGEKGVFHNLEEDAAVLIWKIPTGTGSRKNFWVLVV